MRIVVRGLLAASLIACGNSPAPLDAGRDAAGADAAIDAALDGGIDAGPRPDAGPPPPPPSEPGLHDVAITDTRLIVPSTGLPPETPAMRSNNNLDVIRHDGRVFLAWRTAPNHFAGPDTVIHVASSTDETSWRHETSYTLGTDLREPRFLSIGGSLFLYVSILGTDRLAFEPMGVRAAERRADGTWTGLEDIGLPGYIAWRTRTERGTPYMTAYVGGEHIYRFDGLPLSIDLLTTTDGRAWVPVDPARRTIYMGGGSETDFAIGDDGTLFGVIRNEAGDDRGLGSMVCRAPAGDLANWTCRSDPKKYDSPLMFWHDGEAYLIGRRNVNETGNFDVMQGRTVVARALMSATDYWTHPKRCAIWRYVQGEDRIAFIADLPSRGDTCFPAWIAGESADEVILYDYSSPIDGPDVSWLDGQLGDTYIYRHVLRFTRR
ncbi:MAG: hypothetical protein K8H88_18545 [Sandaracinaceae bacterium]|nr:hypothetical protein [Sandaracinaceae bacterium]